jgi:hypothetical protein
MHFEQSGTSLSYGTPDAPAPEGDISPSQNGRATGIALTFAVKPVEARHAVEARYRVNNGAIVRLAAPQARMDVSSNTQFFVAHLPEFHVGDRVEYVGVLSWPGGQVPSAHEASTFPSSFRVVAARHQSTAGAVAIHTPAKPPAAPLIRRINLRRTPATFDPIGAAAVGKEKALQPFRLAAASKMFGGLQQVRQHVAQVKQELAKPKLPARLVGLLHQPGGSAAARVQVEFDPKSVGATGSILIVLTLDNGHFTFDMPSGATIPNAGLTLKVHGANDNATVNVPTSQIASNGMIGVLILSKMLASLPVSLIAALQALTPVGPPALRAPAPPPNKKHSVTIGEQDSPCRQLFVKGEQTDRFPWSLFFRIVEPQMSILSQTEQINVGKRFGWRTIYSTDAKQFDKTKTTVVDRVPVDQPLSIDGFREQIAGIDGTGTFTEDETVPMAASLGLGYILRLSQRWTFQGLGLGELVYSLPLAPGEQQQVAIFERKDSTSVQEAESFSQAEAMTQSATADTSTNATFNSAFNEMVNGNSNYSTGSTTTSSANSYGGGGGASFGFGPIAIGGGASGSSSNSTATQTAQGSANSSLSGSRDTTQAAAQGTHSAAENQAAARVNANRTGMRMATASENMGVTTKTITNHNHTHALTMQYWQVVRMYDVTTVVEGVNLVCLIPMQIVRFMPPGQPATLSDPSAVDSHAKVTARYENILRHMDILQAIVPRAYQHGLALLAQFAADPTTVVDPLGSSAETVIAFKIQGTFLFCEKISVVALTKRNTRVGPVQLAPLTAGQPSPIPPDTLMTRDEVIAWLSHERVYTITTLQGSLALPASMNRADVIGFEISRQFTTVRYTLTSAAKQAAEQALSQELHGKLPSENFFQMIAGLTPRPTVVLGPGDLEPLLGGPIVGAFYAAVENFNNSSRTDIPSPQETYVNDQLAGIVLPPQPYPVPATQLAPVLRYQDVLEIEKAAQHIVRNTTRYSRTLWTSMTPEESAILLDGYTIGVPADGLSDASQMIPLLNCLQNTILGTFGNSLIMPFSIPQDLADEMNINPAELQQSLLAYQQEAFVAPHSTVALPTRGVLGEAVLGSCPSAEKIDLTRFWNWQDAPGDQAPGIGMVQLPTTTPPLTTGVTAPNSLTNLPPLINNLITAPQPNTGLLQAMGQQAASQQDFSPNFTGQQQLASLVQNAQTQSNAARSDALKSSQAITTQAMTSVENLVKSALQLAKANTPTPTPTKPGQTGLTTTPTPTPTKPGQTGSTTTPTPTSTPTSSNSTLGPVSSLLGDTSGGDAAGGIAGGDAVGAIAGGDAGGAIGGDAAGAALLA